MSVSCLVQVVRAKGTDDVKFPDQDDILELSVTGDSSLFAWAKHFTSMSGIKPLWSKVQTFTEFSGSGCAEVALQSVAHHLGLSGDAVKVGHAADIDPACRRVLLNSRLGFSFLFRFFTCKCCKFCKLVCDALSCKERFLVSVLFPAKFPMIHACSGTFWICCRML